MVYTELADKILTLFLQRAQPNVKLTIAQIAIDLSEMESKVLKVILYPIMWLEIENRIYGISHMTVYKPHGFDDEIKSFLETGGYVQLQKQQSEREEQQRLDDELNRTLTKLSIDQAKQAIVDSAEALRLAREANEISRSAKNAAWIAILAAAGSAILTWWLTKTFG